MTFFGRIFFSGCKNRPFTCGFAAILFSPNFSASTPFHVVPGRVRDDMYGREHMHFSFPIHLGLGSAEVLLVRQIVPTPRRSIASLNNARILILQSCLHQHPGSRARRLTAPSTVHCTVDPSNIAGIPEQQGGATSLANINTAIMPSGGALCIELRLFLIAR